MKADPRSLAFIESFGDDGRDTPDPVIGGPNCVTNGLLCTCPGLAGGGGAGVSDVGVCCPVNILKRSVSSLAWLMASKAR